jgi:broad specificity phosphatase PhoE
MTENIIHLTIVRHGNTNGNRRWLVEGNTDTLLNSSGRYQAELVAERLKNEHFNQICSSDQSRAFDTAITILKEGLKTRIEKCPRLRERHFGVAEKTMMLQHRENAKKEGFKTTDQLTHYVPEGGESDNDVRKRVGLFLENLFANRTKLAKFKNPEWKVLIVSHGLTIREIIRCLVQDHGCTGISDEIMQDGMRLAKSPNTGVTQFSLKLDQENGRVTSGHCTLLQCKRHLQSSYKLVTKLTSAHQTVIYYLELLLAIFLYLLSKLGL